MRRLLLVVTMVFDIIAKKTGKPVTMVVTILGCCTINTVATGITGITGIAGLALTTVYRFQHFNNHQISLIA